MTAKFRTSTSILALGIAFGSTGVARAQLYVGAQYAAPYVPLAGGSAVNPTNTDDGAAIAPIGFTFNFFGVDYTHVNVGVNGVLSFANACSSSAECVFDNDECNLAIGRCELDYAYYDVPALPNADEPHRAIAPFWDDLILGTQAPQSAISTETLGSAPNREFVVEWRDIRHYAGFSGSISRTSFQVRLAESSGAIRIHYGAFVPSAADNGNWSGVLGIENADGTEGVAPLACAMGLSTCDYLALSALADQVIELSIPNSPELVGEVRPPTGGDPGATIAIPVDARNLGPQPTSPFRADVYLSNDLVITPGTDVLLGTLEFASIAARGAATATLTATIPASTPPGLYRVGAIMDAAGVVPEAIETNNTAVSSRVFLVGSDVSIAIDPIPGTGPEESVTFPVRILNNGSPVAAVDFSVYLSSDPSFETGDTLLASGSSALAAVPVTTVTVTATVPVITPGAYYAIAVVDPANTLVEADEANNVAVASATTELRGADVVAADVTGDALVFRGEPYTVTATLRNEGLSAAESFSYSFHLSENQLVTFSDPILGEFGPITLAPGATRVVTHTVSVPPALPTGAYYLGFIADSTSQVLEELENNNVQRRREQVTVRDPAPDFVARAISVPLDAAAGESLTIERIVANDGNAAGVVTYVVYLSQDSAVDIASDPLLATKTLSLSARSEDRGVDQVRIPAGVTAGTYYAAYVIDPTDQASEIREDNNVALSGNTIAVLASELSIRTSALPIATVGLAYDVVLSASGGVGAYSWSIEAGALPEGFALEADSGRLFGAAAREGIFPFTVAVTDGALTAARSLTLLVSEETLPLEIVTRSVLPAVVGRGYEYPLTAFGGVPPYRWTANDPLPQGLALGEAGLISGLPGMATVNTVNFRVTDAAGASSERPIVLRVINPDAALRFSADTLPDGTLGEQYDEDVQVEPGTGASPFHFEIAGGALPDGLVLEENRVQGVPTKVGTFVVAIRVTDGRGDFDTNLFVIAIHEESGVSITTTSLPPGVIGESYADEAGSPVRVKAISAGAVGTTELTFLVASGDLPPGLTLAADGSIEGTPTQGGVFSFLVVARDQSDQIDRRALGIFVGEPAREIVKATDEGCSCALSDANGAASSEVRWEILTAGALLACLVLRSRRRRRRLPVLFLGLLVAIGLPDSAQAQQQIPYFLSTSNEPYVPRTGGAAIQFFDPDEGTAAVTLPFPFHFFDGDYTSVTVGANGLVSFDAAFFLDGFNTTLPDASSFSPNNLIAIFWDDLVLGGASSYVEGAEPNRVFIIQYENVTRYPGGSGDTAFQLWLFEGRAGRFELHFGPTSAIVAADWDGTSGFENAAGTIGFHFLSCSPTCDGNSLMSATGVVHRAQQDAGEEIVSASITGPAVAYPGIPFDVEATIASLHQNPIGPFTYAVHLVPFGEATPNNPIYVSPPVTLSPYQNLSATVPVTVPLAELPGRYRLALVADAGDDVTEPDEANNLLFSSGDIRVEPRRPDFAIAGVAATPEAAAPGATLGVILELSNVGNLDGSAAWSVFLSRNAVVSIDDLEVASGSEALMFGATSSLNVPVRLPPSLAPGAYYVGAVADADNLVSELSEVNNARVSRRTVVVSTASVEVATTVLPGGYAGVAYSTFLSANGGNGTYTWSVTSGMLPLGLTLISTSGEIRGTPREAGTSMFVVQVASGGLSDTKAFAIAIDAIEGGLTIVTRELLPGIVGDAYPPADPNTAPEDQQHIILVGARGPATFSLDRAAPPGLMLEPDGYLHGTPVQRGVFDVVVRATDSTGTALRTIPLTIGEPGRLAIVAGLLPDGTIGEEYQHQLRAIGTVPTATVTFTIASGFLPAGISLSPTGRLSGVPEMVASSIFAVTAMEGEGQRAPVDTANYRIQIVSGADFRITPTAIPQAEVGEPYDVALMALGGRGPFVWNVEGPALPRGLMFQIRTEDGREVLAFTGTPEEHGFVTELVTVTDAAGRRTQVPISLRVVPPQPDTPTVGDEGCGCASLSRRNISISAKDHEGAGTIALLLLGGAMFLGRRFVDRGTRRPR